MAHTVHEFAERRARLTGQDVAGMAKVVEVEARQARRVDGIRPDAAGTRQEEALMTASLMILENIALAARFQVERMTGIEPALSAWEFNELVRIMRIEQ